ncbi:MAG TPA: hypothetical protein VGV67_11590, partial [Solirubrobacteraceae bacterium]|nr:hypothetical protein [Solirubrobacteraceae bacterium]
PFDAGEAAGAFDRVANGGAALGEVFMKDIPELTRSIPGRDLRTNEGLVLIAALLSVACTVAFAPRLRRFAVPALLVASIGFTVAEVRWVFPRVILGISETFPASLPGVKAQAPDWIDRAVAADASVGVLAGRLEEPVLDQDNQWMWHEFWNETVDRAYTDDGNAAFTGWPAVNWRVDPDTGRVAVAEVPDAFLAAPFDAVLKLRGRVVARSADTAVVEEPVVPLQAAWHTENLRFDGTPKSTENRVVTVRTWPGAAPLEDDRLRLVLRGDDLPTGVPMQTLRYRVRDASGTRAGELLPSKYREVTVRGARSAAGGAAVVRVTLPEAILPDGRRMTVRLVAIKP